MCLGCTCRSWKSLCDYFCSISESSPWISLHSFQRGHPSLLTAQLLTVLSGLTPLLKTLFHRVRTESVFVPLCLDVAWNSLAYEWCSVCLLNRQMRGRFKETSRKSAGLAKSVNANPVSPFLEYLYHHQQTYTIKAKVLQKIFQQLCSKDKVPIEASRDGCLDMIARSQGQTNTHSVNPSA